MDCNYCGNEAALVTGKEIYPHREDLFEKRFYQCSNCDAYVGVHPKTIKPLGTLAKKELRDLRLKTHNVFDRLWKKLGLSRTASYNMLQDYFGEEVHIGSSDEKRCKEIINFVMTIS